jgi:2-polyprenyl-3-methyl-5-hydroxy-6-metoxy-1,4-benzoquinol methylase
MRKTMDPVNQSLIELENEIGVAKLGLMSNQVWHDDPKRILFTTSRYKFVSKMLAGYREVAEIGCGDGFFSRIVRQEVGSLTVTDYDPLFIERFSELATLKWPINAEVHDILKAPLNKTFDAVYSLDVMEHIEPKLEGQFLRNIQASLTEQGVAIIGMPSLESQPYASPASKAGHVNCKTGLDFRLSLQAYFLNVFIFSMNDEVVHTGFSPMAHYLIAICCGKRGSNS